MFELTAQHKPLGCACRTQSAAVLSKEEQVEAALKQELLVCRVFKIVFGRDGCSRVTLIVWLV